MGVKIGCPLLGIMKLIALGWLLINPRMVILKFEAQALSKFCLTYDETQGCPLDTLSIGFTTSLLPTLYVIGFMFVKT